MSAERQMRVTVEIPAFPVKDLGFGKTTARQIIDELNAKVVESGSATPVADFLEDCFDDEEGIAVRISVEDVHDDGTREFIDQDVWEPV